LPNYIVIFCHEIIGVCCTLPQFHYTAAARSCFASFVNTAGLRFPTIWGHAVLVIEYGELACLNEVIEEVT
jgi:hypothetical protein